MLLVLSPFLNNGITSAHLKRDGKTPGEKKKSVNRYKLKVN
jgi:hypothetical protein